MWTLANLLTPAVVLRSKGRKMIDRRPWKCDQLGRFCNATKKNRKNVGSRRTYEAKIGSYVGREESARRSSSHLGNSMKNLKNIVTLQDDNGYVVPMKLRLGVLERQTESETRTRGNVGDNKRGAGPVPNGFVLVNLLFFVILVAVLSLPFSFSLWRSCPFYLALVKRSPPARSSLLFTDPLVHSSSSFIRVRNVPSLIPTANYHVYPRHKGIYMYRYKWL